MANPQLIRDALKYYFGFDTFKGNQLEAISDLLDGKNVFVLMPTGGGKSLCYQLPALMSEGTAIVVSPLIALMKNQVDALRHHGDEVCVAHFLNSSLCKSAVEEVKADVREGKTKLLYVAPESLAKQENIEFLKSIKISFIAVDEAHCISEWGHDFRPEYRRIRPMISEIGEFPIIALTATATPKVQHDIMKNLGMTKATVYKSSFNRPNLYYEVRPKTADVERDVIRYVKTHPGQSGIIYCLSRRRVEALADTLKLNGIAALPYHAGMDAATRSVNQDEFLHERVDVIVATIAFGMGIDKPDVRFVIHYDIPKSLEGYYQETGRAGRDGGEGNCITFYKRKDLVKLRKLLQSKPANEQEIGEQLLEEIANYAESSVCRRKILMHYFGEQYTEDNCCNCDNCRNPKTRRDARDELAAALDAVVEVKECHKTDYIVNLLIGRATDEIRANGHDKIEIFGYLADTEEKFVSAVIHQAVIEGYFERDLENYGILKITDAGIKFMEHGRQFMVVEDVDYAEQDNEAVSHSGAANVADEELYGILKGLRKDIARKLNLPPYVIFQDVSLEAMAIQYPITPDEMLAIPGVGSGKARRFGKPFIEVIAKYVEENDIDRPDDIMVRMRPKKNNRKIQIIQAIDRKIPLDELAETLGIEFDELVGEIEAIVDTGTGINIEYYIRTIFDEDQEEELRDCFMEMQEDDIEEVIQEFGADYDEEDLRLARVHFISSLGN
jgi:ATP-dependent DNA helicase RecQ